jgi:hypothetical protein
MHDGELGTEELKSNLTFMQKFFFHQSSIGEKMKRDLKDDDRKTSSS